MISGDYSSATEKGDCEPQKKPNNHVSSTTNRLNPEIQFPFHLGSRLNQTGKLEAYQSTACTEGLRKPLPLLPNPLLAKTKFLSAR